MSSTEERLVAWVYATDFATLVGARLFPTEFAATRWAVEELEAGVRLPFLLGEPVDVTLARGEGAMQERYLLELVEMERRALREAEGWERFLEGPAVPRRTAVVLAGRGPT